MFSRSYIKVSHDDITSNITLLVTRLICKSEYKIVVPVSGYLDWLNGVGIQYALPHLTPDERELLISGFCSKCFDKMFD